MPQIDVTTPNAEIAQVTPQVEVATEAQTPAPAEEFDKDRAMKTISNLREIEKQAKKDAKELETLRAERKQRSEDEMTELQRAQKQADDVLAENVRLKSDLIRSKVIAAVNLPSIFADRLQGSNYEEMLADAKKIADVLPKQSKTAPTLNATNPANGQTTETDAQQRERLFGKQGNPFDLAEIKARGGGVIFDK